MELSQFTDFSLRVLIRAAVCEPNELITVREIADSYGISYNHVAKVTHNLAINGYLNTMRGRGGGIFLARPASQIGVGEIVRKTENFTFVECLKTSGGNCCISPACGLKNIINEAKKAFLDVLDGYSLADIAHKKSILRSLFDLTEPVPAK